MILYEGYDLIILKDVIQHWTDESIMNYLPKILDKNKYVLLPIVIVLQRSNKRYFNKKNINNQYKYHL